MNVKQKYSCFLVLSAGFGWLFSWLVSYVLSSIIAENSSLFWLSRFINTVSDYGTIFLPFFVLIHFTKKHNLHNQGTSVEFSKTHYFDFLHYFLLIQMAVIRPYFGW